MYIVIIAIGDREFLDNLFFKYSVEVLSLTIFTSISQFGHI